MKKKLEEKMRMIKTIVTRARMAVFAAILFVVLTVGGISAYFTDRDTVTNTFTVGKISLELQEPDWDPEEAQDITPNQTIKKNPQIYNDGLNGEFVFMEVILPYETLITANEDGTLNEASDTELYRYTINPGWHQMAQTKNETEKTVTYLYVYGSDEICTELTVGTATPSLFDTVTFANVVENQALEGKTLEIIVKAYGIQTTNINGGKAAPADVWTVLWNGNLSGVNE